MSLLIKNGEIITADIHGMKLQIPSSKLQRNFNNQAANAGAWPHWTLKFGASLELGAWCLEFNNP